MLYIDDSILSICKLNYAEIKKCVKISVYKAEKIKLPIFQITIISPIISGVFISVVYTTAGHVHTVYTINILIKLIA
jgi:hypothetical protein